MNSPDDEKMHELVQSIEGWNGMDILSLHSSIETYKFRLGLIAKRFKQMEVTPANWAGRYLWFRTVDMSKIKSHPDFADRVKVLREERGLDFVWACDSQGQVLAGREADQFAPITCIEKVE